MKSVKLFVAAAVAAALAVGMPVAASAAPTASSTTWSKADIAVSAKIFANTASTRTNASGPKLPSSAYSADYPGVYFTWDTKQQDTGYLKVDASVFDKYESFILTIKESNKYYDFTITPQDNQNQASDGSYIFFLPEAANNKNINMVFLGSWEAKTDDADSTDDSTTTDYPTYSIAFMVYYFYQTGGVGSTSVGWQDLKPGECIETDYITNLYNDYADQGYFPYPDNGFRTDGIDPKTFGANTPICYDQLTANQRDLGPGNTESYVFYLDPGLPQVVTSFERYVSDVNHWNDLYNGVYATDEGRKETLRIYGGLDHYNALVIRYGLENVPSHYTYFPFTWDPTNEYGHNYDFWSDQFEAGFKLVSQ